MPGEYKGPFDVSVDDLKRLSAADAVNVFQELLLEEAKERALPISAVSVPKALNTGDGGVDAELELAEGIHLPVGLIREGLVRYQIKTGSFSISGLSDIKELLIAPRFRALKSKLGPDHLQPRVRSCLDKGGAFVVVLFGDDLVGKSDGHGVAQIKAFLLKIDVKYKNIDIRVIRANQLCAAIRDLCPSIALSLNGLAGREGHPLHNIKFLKQSCGLELNAYKRTPELAIQAEEIEKVAKNPTGFKHIRILGEAGAGKTHLVYDALKNEQQVLYCADPEQLDNSSAFSQLLNLSEGATVVLIADDCDTQTANLLQVRLQNRAIRCLLISIFNQVEDSAALGDKVPLVEVPQLDDASMAEIFSRDYRIPNDKARWLAELCRGSPRAAHKIGQYISQNPALDYAHHFSKLDDFWNVLVCSPDAVQSTEGTRRLTIARTIALFRRLAWDGPDGAAGKKILGSLVQKVDQSVSVAAMAAAVTDFKRRRILQGGRTLYLSPTLLHVTLWRDWWETFEHVISVEEIRAQLQGRMLGWFDEMFAFAKESKAATNVVERLLGIQGPFKDLAGFAQEGNPELFFALAQANPKAALRRLKDALEAASESELKAFKNGRREVVHGLERLAIPAETFFEAVDCLLILAVKENEQWSNNATGVFTSMFTLGYGRVAASEVGPQEKIPYLRNLIFSGTPAERKLAIRAVHESLSPFLSRGSVGDLQGLRQLPDRWMPKTSGDIVDAYLAHIELMAEAEKKLDSPDGDVAAHAVISHARSLLQIQQLAPRMVDLLREFSEKKSLRESVVEEIETSIHFDSKSLADKNVLGSLTALRKDLTEGSFSNRLRRHAGLQLVEDHFDENGNYTNHAAKPLLELASEVLVSPALLVEELHWLVTSEAKNGFRFGEALGERDTLLSLWPPILEAWLEAGSRGSDYFPGGYLAGLFKQDVGLWDLVIGDLFHLLDSRSDLLALIWRSGMSDSVAFAILDLAKSGEIDAKSLNILIYGGVVNELPRKVFTGIIDLLLKIGGAEEADAALTMLDARMRGQQEEVSSLLKRLALVLRHRSFVVGDRTRRNYDNMREYRWTQSAKRLLELDPPSGIELAKKCIAHFGGHQSITGEYYSSAFEFFDRAIQVKPVELWNAISRRLKPRIDSNTYKLLQWLRGERRSSVASSGRVGIEFVPMDLVLQWIAASPKSRAPMMAQYCPPYLSDEGEPASLARLILEKYGDSRDVRSGFHANYFTGVFSGPASAHYKERLDEIRRQLALEKNAYVKIWLREQEASLVDTVQRELDAEEARGW